MSWYKKADFPQYDVFHGTGDQDSIHDKGFVCDFMGQGHEQYGPGFYFTNSNETAIGYSQNSTEAKSPGVIRAKVNLRKPIKVNARNVTKSNVFSIFPNLNYSQNKTMINLATKIKGEHILDDWGDIKLEGVEKVIDRAARSYTGRSAAFIMYDLFDKNNLPQALKFITQTTGYDGIIISHGENINPSKSNEKWVVAWYPEQIEIIRDIK